MKGELHSTVRSECPLYKRHVPSDGVYTGGNSCLQSRAKVMEATRTGVPNISVAFMAVITAIVRAVTTIAVTMYLLVPIRPILPNTFLPVVSYVVIFAKTSVGSTKFNVAWDLLVQETMTDIISRVFILGKWNKECKTLENVKCIIIERQNKHKNLEIRQM